MTKLKFIWDEEEFQKAYKEMATKMGLSLDPDDPKHFYDYRALYKETGKLEPDETGHFPSKFKLEGHPRMEVGGIDTKTGATLTMLPPTYKIQSLALKEEYERKTLETPGITQRMRGIGEIPKKYSLEGITTELSEVNKRRFNLWWSEFRATEDKWKFIRHENWSPELIQLNRESMMLSGEASKLGVNTGDWIEYGAYTAFFATMAAGILPILKGLPTEVLNKLTYKVEGKTVKGKELFEAIRRCAYPDPRAGFGAPSIRDKKILEIFTKKGGLKGIGGSIKGIEIIEVTPRFAFGTKLYAGLPADEIAKSIVQAGKVTADMVKGLDPAKVTQVTQLLTNVAPALASEFSKIAIQVKPKITEIPKLTKTERKILESPVDLGEGKVTFSWAEIAPKAREIAITKLEERGYVKDTLLTEKGIELSNVLKARIEEEEKGIPIAEKEIKRPMTDKQLAKISPNEELILGKIEGVDYYTDTRVMLKGKPKDVPISKEKPDFEKTIADLPKEETEIKPIIYSKKGDLEPLVWFDNKVAIKEPYYDFIIKKFPEAEFRSVEKIDLREPTPKAPIKIYEKDEFVGVIMAYRQDLVDIPESVLVKVAPKPPIEPPEKVEEVKRVEPVVREEIPKVEVKPEKVLKVEKALGFEVKPTIHKEKEEALKLAVDAVKKMGNWAGELKVMGTFVAKTDKPYSDIDVMVTTDNYLKVDAASDFGKIQKDILSKTGVFVDFSHQGIPTGKTKQILLKPTELPVKIKPTPKPEVKREVEVKPEEIYKEGEKIPTKKVKGEIRKITGQIPEKIEIAERDMLRLVLRGEAKGARKAFSEGKKKGIFGAKEKFTEVVARAKERKYKRDEIGKVKDILKKTDLKKLRPERQKAVKNIIDEIDIRKMTEKTKRRLTSRLDFIKDNPENQIPPEKIVELERLNKKPISDFTAEDISLIKDSILHEINLNKLKNKIIFGKEIKEAVGELKKARENVLKGKDIKKDDLSIIDSGITEHRTSWQKIKNIWGIQSFNPEVICEELDFKDHGEVMKYIFNGIDNGVTEKFKIMQEADDWFLEELKGVDISKWGKAFQGNRKNIDFQTIELSANKELKIPKRKIKITKGERVSFLLHEKNNKNLDHLTKGGFRFSDNLSRKYKMTEENIEEIINSATAGEVKVADTLWKFFNEFIKPKLNEASMELNGWEIATEDNYYPIRTVSLDRIRDALKARKTFDNKTLEGMGIFKERVNAKNALIIEDAFTVAYKHLEQTSSYIGLAKPLRYAKLILEDTEFNENVRKIYGKEYISNLKKYLQNIEGEAINLDNVDNLAVDLINKLDSAILGAHIFVMFKQPVSYLIANTEIEAKYLKKAILKKSNFKEIRENSPQLRSRLDGNITRELGELGNVGKVRKFFLHKSPLNSKVLAGIRKFDSFTIGKIWNACKLEVKEKCPLLSEEKYMEKVTERAEEVIRRTQPTWHPKDRSEIARSKSIFIRLLTKYTSQRNKNRIVLKRATLKYNRSRHTTTDKISLLKKYAIVLIANALLIEAINELRRKAYGTKSRSIWQYTVAAIGTALSNFYVVGDLFNSLASKIQKGTYAGYDTGNIVTSYMDNAIDGLAELGRTLEQLKNNERYESGSRKGNLKYKTSAVRALDKNASTLLSLKGLPYENIKRLLVGIWKMAGEKEEKKPPPLKITIPKSGKLKFIEPKLDTKSKKLKFTF